MYVRDGRRKAFGLGPYPEVKLAQARQVAAKMRELTAMGSNPATLRQRGITPTFSECVDEFLATMEGQWRNEKHRAQWRMTLGPTYCRSIVNRSVDQISTDDVLSILSPIWTTKHETASRLRGRLERVLDFAKSRGWRVGENPALWRGHLKNLLPTASKLQRGHHPAMPYSMVPDFYLKLAGTDAMAARCLQLVILTACRSGEALNAVWAEIDFDHQLWIIPAERMKAGRTHRIPLSTRATSLLRDLFDRRQSDFLFPGQNAARPLSNMAMGMLMRRMNLAHYTVHGFRSAFRDWAGDETAHPREIAEGALAHIQGDQTERAYRRSDALQKRRRLMEDWCEFLGQASR